ncbi:MAG: flagellar export chaperone FliS [Planctomycetes bacterium]|nr:flagellar export chaperone FliS [Planctomycetota bacterium]
MVPNLAKNYFETQVRTASKEQLLLMLFDGAIRFAEQGKERMLARDTEGQHKGLVRAQRIMMELLSALDPSIGEELHGNLAGLYNFVYFRLVQANLKRDPVLIDEALKILANLRETWGEAVVRARQESASGVSPLPVPDRATSDPTRPAISLEG